VKVDDTSPQNGNLATSMSLAMPDTGAPMLFTYTPDTHVMTITLDRAPPGTEVPEPGTPALLLAALLGLAATRIPARSEATCRTPSC